MLNFITFFTHSSEDPTKISATLTGLLISLSAYLQSVVAPHIPVIASFYNSPLGQNAEQICTSLGMVIGGIWFLFGLLRKASNKVEEKVQGMKKV